MKLTTLIRSLLLGATLSAGSLFANSVKIYSTGYNGVPDAGGGEFRAVTSNDGTFLTFCMEHSVSINAKTAYSYTIDDTVLQQNDALSKGTAYLYTAFLFGGLPGYLANHDVNAGLLQTAFWILEDEVAYDGSNPYIAMVNGLFGGFAGAHADYTGDKVKALNIWDANSNTRTGYDKQSMLIYVPDSGMTAVLLGLGLLSLAAFRRKL